MMNGELTSLERRLAVRSRPPLRSAMYQSWQELLFLHWEFDRDIVQATLPAGLTVDTFGGRAWIGVVPFFMRRIRPWWLPSLPLISNFLELNCRTYVVDRDGTPGVWFYSLDTNSPLAVWGARKFYHLPYYHARMSSVWDAGTGRVDFRSHRRGTSEKLASRFVYEPRGAAATSEPGTLEFFLVERYVLFADCGPAGLKQGIVHHPPYQVSPVAVDIFDDALLELNGFRRPGSAPAHAMMSRGVNVDVFALRSGDEMRNGTKIAASPPVCATDADGVEARHFARAADGM